VRLIDSALLWVVRWRLRAAAPIMGRPCRFADALLELLAEQARQENARLDAQDAADKFRGLQVVPDSKCGNISK